MRVLFTCGGSGGHIYPAIAVAQVFRRRESSPEILFVGAEGAMETRIVPEGGFAIRTVRVSNLAHSISPKAIGKNIKSAARLAGALRKAGQILDEFKPDIVIGTGGYACFPVLYRAHGRGIPTLLHESNATPGLTTRLLAKRVDRVMTGFSGLENQYPKPGKVVCTGTPVREEFLFADRASARREFNLDARPVVVSAFGSLGARDMNIIMADVLENAARRGAAQMLHAAGSRYIAALNASLTERGVTRERYPNIRVCEYFDNMPSLMAAADLFIGRAGASTLNELMVTGTPAVLIPSPNVTNDHQTSNANKMKEQCGVEVLAEKGLTADILTRTVENLLAGKEKLSAVSRALTSAAVPDAAQRIYELAKSLITP
ncbi:MAG: UDP-N-acetylglucosamine--N-acetylmuramyl-(pentapeptide) pyrophosphoryl-undecaprenol N-acetylglucosamine transferase [Oscillospiraceae bacterium]|jgi:UDP-N-acetylglucosamine--N-acetylmuramyl-(pentapeptide) pyrophosphoryl-undecaprenol N-acetylglucosamine transferase|nr:UDP-N-acetylglucosamine--N-acetylmuramyl-(pentapeptide) pyrophosphoryl-undecaprenol N-acetylglucosamine transferase [Oscillospiraceae bacterium]